MKDELVSLASIIRTSITSSVKRVLVGRDDEPKMSDLPQVQIWPVSTLVTISGTVKDEQSRTIAIRVIDSVKSKMGQGTSSQSTMSSVLTVCNLMEKREASGAFATTSILGILRNNLDLNGQVYFEEQIEVDYSNIESLKFPNAVAETRVVFKSRRLTT